MRKPCVVNALERDQVTIEGGAQSRRVITKKEHGSKISLSIVYMEPGKGHKWHNHPDKDEVAIVIKGGGTFTYEIDNKRHEVQMKEMDAFFAPAGCYHQFINTTNEMTVVIAVLHPPLV